MVSLNLNGSCGSFCRRSTCPIDFFMIQELAVLTEALKMNCGQILGFVRRSCDFELRQTQIL
ncbi:hypothetical protein A6X21_10140 [Planctopirus hydrillae]|uniref:Uncharacterized protein n=1 Tax=Planctopirus hydrillae TaxID=1841610 RepID=A0A1C3E747_9PLAN|nr:hypothetical protein A6X21_10140 [Planctopirus hydrillae]